MYNVLTYIFKLFYERLLKNNDHEMTIKGGSKVKHSFQDIPWDVF